MSNKLAKMGEIKQHRPVLLILAVITRHDAALDWAEGRATGAWGEVALSSEQFDFSETRFYEPTMGKDLKKKFLAFVRLIDPASLVALKHQTNGWELEYAQLGRHPEPRPLNLDPGYLTEAKLVLATTKDRDHRLYLGRGVYAEVTLYFQRGRWRTREWTYPDYRRGSYHRFFAQCRDYLRGRYRQRPSLLGRSES